MTLLHALARAEQQRRRNRPLEVVLHDLAGAIQHHLDLHGTWLAEVRLDEDGRPLLQPRAATGTLSELHALAPSVDVQAALLGQVLALPEGTLGAGMAATVLPLEHDLETRAIWVLAHGPEGSPDALDELLALGAIVGPWFETARHANADRLARRHLESAADRYRAVMYEALDAILLVDDDGRVVEANGQADRILPGGWRGQRLCDHVDAPHPLPLGRHTLRLGASGLPTDIVVHAIPGSDGPTRAVVLRDTHEQRRTADALRDLNEQLKARVTELGRLSRENELLGELGAFLQASRTAEDVHGVVRRYAGELLGGRGALYDLKDGVLQRMAGWGEGELPLHFDRDACWALRRGELHACEGPSGLACHHAHADRTLCMPVSSSSGPAALLHVELDEQPPRVARVARLLRAMADRLGAALTNLALQQRLRQESIRDPLTRLYNRRYMVETMARELARTGRAEQPLAVIMVDVDHFKRLNDTYGHDVGDRVLREVARRISLCVRTEDVVCRYGGEEFVVILPGATEELARGRAEAFRSELAARPPTRDGPLVAVTVSAGVAVAMQGASPEQLLRRADEALLQAKRSGRDRIVVASDWPAGLVVPKVASVPWAEARRQST